MRVLIVEDEQALREGLTDLLSAAGHEVVACEFGKDAVAAGTERAFDLVLLDLMLPDLDGVEVCRRLRRARPSLHILMLTARGSEDDKVTGLEAGADDYLTKPFAVRELLARINALGRRAAALPSEPEVLEIDGCTLDLGRLEAVRGEATFKITPREAGILRWLHRHRARAVSRGELLERIWGSSGDLQTRTVDMTIANLRQKIERDPSEPRILLTVTGAGYAWGGDEEP
jgi:two-component system alkaline phosphatase synthesis response regulator PhoP